MSHVFEEQDFKKSYLRGGLYVCFVREAAFHALLYDLKVPIVVRLTAD